MCHEHDRRCHSVIFDFGRYYDRLQFQSQALSTLELAGSQNFKKLLLSVFYISYQALHAGNMTGIYRDRIVKTVLGISKVFSDFENAATLQRKQERKPFQSLVEY